MIAHLREWCRGHKLGLKRDGVASCECRPACVQCVVPGYPFLSIEFSRQGKHGGLKESKRRTGRNVRIQLYLMRVAVSRRYGHVEVNEWGGLADQVVRLQMTLSKKYICNKY